MTTKNKTESTENTPIVVKLKVLTINPDTRQYMQQTKVLEPIDLYVGVEIPAELVQEVHSQYTVLSLEGYKHLTDALENIYLQSNLPTDEAEKDEWEEWEEDETEDEDW